MLEHRYGVKLKSAAVSAAAVKILRKEFPNQSLAELRAKIQARDYIYLSDMEKYQGDGKRRIARLLREFDQAGVEAELFEEHRDTPGPWQTRPMSRELLGNSIRRTREIERQTLEDMERETVGYISPEAAACIGELIEKQSLEDAEWEIAAVNAGGKERLE